MPNTKHKARQPTVIQIHEEWAVKNGYAQARKRASAQGHKPASVQALKRQAVREPTSVERAPNHCL